MIAKIAKNQNIDYLKCAVSFTCFNLHCFFLLLNHALATCLLRNEVYNCKKCYADDTL